MDVCPYVLYVRRYARILECDVRISPHQNEESYQTESRNNIKKTVGTTSNQTKDLWNLSVSTQRETRHLL